MRCDAPLEASARPALAGSPSPRCWCSSPIRPCAQGTLSALQTDVDQIARRARPSVVTVIAQRDSAQPRRDARARPPSRRNAHAHARRLRRRGRARPRSSPPRASCSAPSACWSATAQRSPGRGRARRRRPDLQPGAAPRPGRCGCRALKFAQGAPRAMGDWVMSLGTLATARSRRSRSATSRYRHREPRLVAAPAHEHGLSRQQRRRGAQRARRAGRHRAGRARARPSRGRRSPTASGGRAA